MTFLQWFIRMRLRVRSLLRRGLVEQELDDEMAFHLEAKTRAYEARGLSREEASIRAYREMDGLEQQKEACRDERSVEWAEATLRVLRHASRRLMRSPVFVLVTIGTLALGIGASTAVFSLINGILLKPLPFRNPNQLALVKQSITIQGKHFDEVPVSASHWVEWKKSAPALEGVSLLGWSMRYLVSEGDPERIMMVTVSPGFFEMIGVSTSFGRTFRDGEDQPGKDQVVMLSHTLWRDRYRADPAVIGRKLLINNMPVEVIGVLPDGFTFVTGNDLGSNQPMPPRVDIWAPHSLEKGQFNTDAEFNHIAIARIRDGIGIATAQAQMTELSRGLVAGRLGVGVALYPLPELVAKAGKRSLFLLMAAVGALFAICCVNVANLMLARMLAQRRDFGLRASLGAGRGHLYAEMLSESMLLAGAGGILGVFAAYWLLLAIPQWSAVDLPRLAHVGLDGRVLLFAVAVSLASGFIASLLPACRFTKADPQSALRQRFGSDDAHARGWLVGLEVALCVVLLVAAGLFARSLGRVMQTDRGFAIDNVATLSVQVPSSSATTFRAVLASLESMPGVTAVGAINQGPMRNEMGINGVHAEGQAAMPIFQQSMANYRVATPGYFTAGGLLLRSGRIFQDSESDRDTAVISVNVAARVWPGQDAIGRKFKRNGQGDWIRVIGVVADVRQRNLETAAPMMVYRPADATWRALTVTVRSALPLQSLEPAVRSTLRRVEPGLLLGPMRTMRDLVDETTARRRWQASLLEFFALAAAMLAALGIYGVVTYSVTQRRAEIGVRMALGATTQGILSLVLRQGLKPVWIGGALGILGAIPVVGLARGFLFGVEPLDPASFAFSVAGLVVVAAIACFTPARAAARIDPAEALRRE